MLMLENFIYAPRSCSFKRSLGKTYLSNGESSCLHRLPGVCCTFTPVHAPSAPTSSGRPDARLGRAVNFDWIDQPTLPGAQRADFYWEGPAGTGAAIASALRGWEQLRYEVTEDAGNGTDGARWMHTPALGIFYAQTDTAGNVVVPEDRIRYAMEVAGASVLDLHRELRTALGQDWDDELDVFRHAGENSPVVWLHRAG